MFTNPSLLDLDVFSLPVNPECEVFLLNSPPPPVNGESLYIIRQDGDRRGLFSLVLAVICHIHFSRRFDLIPVVDFSVSRSIEYYDNDFTRTDRLKRSNPWDFYFEPVSHFLYDSDFSSRTVLASTYSFPKLYPQAISRIRELRAIAQLCIRPAADLAEEIQKAKDSVFEGHRVLGVHFRGKDMRVTPGHPLPPTRNQMFEAIERAVRDYDFDRIFVVSEDSELVSFVLQRFPGMAVTLPHFRAPSGINSYRLLTEHFPIKHPQSGIVPGALWAASIFLATLKELRT